MTLEKFNQLLRGHSEFYASEMASGYRHPAIKFEKADIEGEWNIYKASKNGWSYSGHLNMGELFSFIHFEAMEIWVKF
jgi:hypothetical protein